MRKNIIFCVGSYTDKFYINAQMLTKNYFFERFVFKVNIFLCSKYFFTLYFIAWGTNEYFSNTTKIL